MRKVRWAGWLGAVATLALVTGPAVADIASDRAAAIVKYPTIMVDVEDSEDTIIQLSNTSDDPVRAHCFYVNGNSHCSDTGLVCESAGDCPTGVCGPATCNETDFYIRLTPRQPLGWLASEGLADSDLPLDGLFMTGVGGSSNAGTRVPPVAEDPYIGELKCVVVNDAGEPVDSNVLKGEATIVTSDGDLDIAKYNAIGIQAITGAVNTDRELVIGGPAPEYNGCPNVLVLNHFFDNVSDPASEGTIHTNLSLVPCEQDLYRQIPASTVVQYLVYNEFEQRFSTSRTVECRQHLYLSEIDTTQSDRSIFSAGVAGTVTGQTRLTPLEVGLLGVALEDHSPASAAFNVHFQGDRLDPDMITLP